MTSSMRSTRFRGSDSFRVVVNGIGALVVLVGIVFIVLAYRRPTVGTVFLALGWVSIVAFYFFAVQAARALFHGEDVLALGTPTEQLRADLEREKKALLKAIKEIEFDEATGKLDKADAEEQITSYRQRAMEVMRLLDSSAPQEYVEKVEQELKRRLEQPVPAPGTCAGCSAQNDADATFCKKCGKKLGDAGR